MSRKSSTINTDEAVTRPQPRTTEGREIQIASLAVDLAEKKIRDGTASNQLIIHYLNIASSNNRLEKELLEKKKELMDAKIELAKSNSTGNQSYIDAINALKSYSGESENYEDIQ